MVNNKNIQLLNVLDKRWQSFIKKSSLATIFHHPAWIQLLDKCYGYHSFIFALVNSDNQIVAGMPFTKVNSSLTGRRWVSLPFTDYCQALYYNYEEFSKLIEYLIYYYNIGAIPKLEVRGELLANPLIYSYSGYVIHKLKLDSNIKKIVNNFSHMHQRNIKIAQKKGLYIEWGNKEKHIQAFYNLHLQTRRHQGAPIQPLKFFKLLKDIILDQGLGFILLARYKDKYLAGAIFLTWRNMLIYKYGASCRKELKFRPNNFIFYNAIRWGCENGYTLFDMGRTKITNIGLRNFKNGWGSEEEVLVYSKLGNPYRKLTLNYFYPLARKVISKSPLFLCRIAGKLLYTHFA
ncbi:MAG: lipid II:glycine glycyltransferase FemX [Candidatus Helarchaeota archaeon]